MKRPWLVAVLGVLLAAAGFGWFYGERTAPYRALERQCGPELAWIKQEFRLNDADFARIRELHEAYKPVCAELCRRIDATNRELAQLLQSSSGVTPRIEQVLAETAQLRQQCQTRMLEHFFAVSRAMPAEQGRRYLAWMQAQTLSPSHDAMLPRVGDGTLHEHHRQR